MSDQSVISVLEELEACSGRLDKEAVLRKNIDNELLKRVFVAALDPYTVYYVNKFKMPPAKKGNAEDDDAITSFLGLLTRLSARELTGNDAKERVRTFLGDYDSRQQKWCLRVILKNLRVGVQESTLNRVWPGLVKSFAVALAEVLKSEFVKGEGIKILESVSYPVRVEPKLDGLRCITVKHGGKVTFFTRNGTELDSMPKIKAILEESKFDDIVLDGEGMAVDWNESASVMMSKTQKDDSNLHYNVFDAMPFADWRAQQTTLLYSERVQLVERIVSLCTPTDGPARVRQVPHITVRNETELKTYFTQCMDEGYEGVMLKTMDTPYKFKRSKHILKLKPVVTFEGVVVGNYDGRRGTKNEGKFGGFYVMLPNDVITRVGGGYNDQVKAQIQLDGRDTWNGKIVECEAQPDPMTSDGLTKDGKMRFPVYCRTRDASDVDSSVPATWDRWTELAESERLEKIRAASRDREDNGQ